MIWSSKVYLVDPAKNSFGCYNLFRAYPNRFVEVKPEEIKCLININCWD